MGGFLGHLNATLAAFNVPQAERDAVVGFVQSTKADIVESWSALFHEWTNRSATVP